MTLFKCKMCGGNLEVNEGVTVVECQYCGTRHTASDINKQNGEKNIAPMMERAFILLEDAKWDSANKYAEQVLDISPENEYAYLIKLLADRRVKTKEDLQNCKYTFEENENYQKILKYGSQSLIDELKTYVSCVKREAVFNEIKNYIQWAKEAQTTQDIQRLIRKTREKINESDYIEQCKEFVSECDKITELTEKYESEMKRNINEITSAIKVSYEEKKDKIKNEIEVHKNTSNYLEQQYDELGIFATVKKIKIKRQIDEEKQKIEQLENKICALEQEEKQKILDCCIEKEEELGVIYGKRYLDLGMPNVVRTIDLNTKIADIKAKKVGEIVRWGSRVESYGRKKDVEWIILRKEDDKILVFACMYFARMKLHSVGNEGYDSYLNTYCDWEECSLRKWLNDEFKNTTFNEREQKRIIDSIFLLSEEEYDNYRVRSYNYLYSDKLDWWLRPVMNKQCKDNVKIVDAKSNYGKVKHSYFDHEHAVRPAMWIKIA